MQWPQHLHKRGFILTLSGPAASQMTEGYLHPCGKRSAATSFLLPHIAAGSGTAAFAICNRMLGIVDSANNAVVEYRCGALMKTAGDRFSPWDHAGSFCCRREPASGKPGSTKRQWVSPFWSVKKDIRKRRLYVEISIADDTLPVRWFEFALLYPGCPSRLLSGKHQNAQEVP